MSKWFLYVMLSPLMTPQERADTRQYFRQQRAEWCTRHLIADDPYDEQTQQRKREKENDDHGT